MYAKRAIRPAKAGRRPCDSLCTGVHDAHEPRNCSASPIWLSVTASQSDRSAMVLATRSTRSCARADRPSRSAACATRRRAEGVRAAWRRMSRPASAPLTRTPTPRRAVALRLPLAGGGDARPDLRRRRLAAGAERQGRERHRRQIGAEIDAIAQRAGQARRVLLHRLRRAAARRAAGGRRSRTDTGSSPRPAGSGQGSARSAPPAQSTRRLLRAAGGATSSARRVNSGISSRNRTPWCASVTSPGRGCDPPPTSAASEIV